MCPPPPYTQPKQKCLARAAHPAGVSNTRDRGDGGGAAAGEGLQHFLHRHLHGHNAKAPAAVHPEYVGGGLVDGGGGLTVYLPLCHKAGVFKQPHGPLRFHAL